MLRRPCLTCGTLQTDGAHCHTHRRNGFTRTQSTAYRDPAYRRNSRHLKTQHLLEHGELCPGAPDLDHEPHPCPARNLTCDHIIPIAEGGTHDRSNLRILCWEQNIKAGAALGNRRANP